MIQSGRLTESLEIHEQTSTLNEWRERVDTWSKITNGDVRAEVITKRGGEQEARSGQVKTTEYEIRMHYRGDVSEANRLVWGSKTLDIEHLENVNQRNQELLIIATDVSIGGTLSR